MKVLLAEDEKDMSSALTAILQHSGYEVDSVYDGRAAMEYALKNVYDCLIFDIMMPKMDGIEALKIIRQKGNFTPVIMLTAKSEIDDRITGLDAGADDYLMKPFSVGELLARIRSLTRRNTQFSPLTLSAGSVQLNIEEQNLSCQNSISLNHKETKLMKLFMTNMDKSLSTNHIFSTIWSDETDADENIVWIYISYLREKLESINADIQIIGQKGQDYLLTNK
ncbi:response regulator transcription factor [uncultured Megamonas sp.]|uniref:response regulator transcription factor n=1 Tax=uncultured Megamonas sp. TaxID=286140 RepID=UPI00266F148D|nr:response regulator transcription factor [uncultured Megamonas sp.]